MNNNLSLIDSKNDYLYHLIIFPMRLSSMHANHRINFQSLNWFFVMQFSTSKMKPKMSQW